MAGGGSVPFMIARFAQKQTSTQLFKHKDSSSIREKKKALTLPLQHQTFCPMLKT
jgi:hypothetical protein